MPSKEHGGSSVVSLRLPETLLERLDRYCDWMESHRGEPSSRHHAMRQALTQWLDRQEEQGGMTHPDVLRQHFHAAYTSLRSGQDEVDIHRLRHLLNWPSERFDAVLEQLRAEFQVALHVGEPSDLSDAQRRHSYAVNGQLYLRLAWQDGTAINVWPPSPSCPLKQAVGVEVKRPERLEVILTLSDLFLPELTWSATPSSLYCVSWSIAFIEVGATTAIPKRLCKEMQYA